MEAATNWQARGGTVTVIKSAEENLGCGNSQPIPEVHPIPLLDKQPCSEHPFPMVRTKSVHSPIDAEADGLRILAARLRGRGLPKSRYHVWMANLGPSEKLLRAFQEKKVSWQQFARSYRKELYESGTIDRRNTTIKNHGQKFTLRLLQVLAARGTVTLLCHCSEDEPHCHRHVLREVLEGDL